MIALGDVHEIMICFVSHGNNGAAQQQFIGLLESQ
jgi:hypothetical protein